MAGGRQLQRLGAAGQQAAAFLDGDIDIIQVALKLDIGDGRTHLGGGVQRIAHLQRLGAGGHGGDELVIDAGLHEDARLEAVQRWPVAK